MGQGLDKAYSLSQTVKFVSDGKKFGIAKAERVASERKSRMLCSKMWLQVQIAPAIVL